MLMRPEYRNEIDAKYKKNHFGYYVYLPAVLNVR